MKKIIILVSCMIIFIILIPIIIIALMDIFGTGSSKLIPTDQNTPSTILENTDINEEVKRRKEHLNKIIKIQ